MRNCPVCKAHINETGDHPVTADKPLCPLSGWWLSKTMWEGVRQGADAARTYDAAQAAESDTK